MSKWIIVGLIFLFTFLVNLPFGALRAKARKYSLKWFLYIHLPIPLIVLLRVLSHVEYYYIPIFIVAALLGQFSGGKLSIS